jgi:glycine/D-amino acid oxidase-like deaminating enzyme
MKVAVVGGGLAGVAAAWSLIARGWEVVLYDPSGIGGGATGASSGLLHPFLGKRANLSPHSGEAMESARLLIEVAEKELGRSVASRSGILRPAVTEEQRNDFAGKGVWWSEEEMRERVPGAVGLGGLWVEEGITVFVGSYLEGLWRACERRGARLVRERKEDAVGFDAVVWATGAEVRGELGVKRTAGQMAICRWKKRLPFSLVSQGYIALMEQEDLCSVGATYERGELMDDAGKVLKEKVALFYPPALEFEVVGIKSGVRVSRKEGVLPVVERVGDKEWVFTGLGSRGMLYHGLFGAQLAQIVRK